MIRDAFNKWASNTQPKAERDLEAGSASPKSAVSSFQIVPAAASSTMAVSPFAAATALQAPASHGSEDEHRVGDGEGGITLVACQCGAGMAATTATVLGLVWGIYMLMSETTPLNPHRENVKGGVVVVVLAAIGVIGCIGAIGGAIACGCLGLTCDVALNRRS